ncbi:MAG: RdgB/HAM1 family non-canonical purine NTP pyrophosphatase [Bdellovibrionales bacterium]|nr:RdgB/HAM1 family non-canonical purine NTP pyrophosphatase [Bdellovibrionales bacterium]
MSHVLLIATTNKGKLDEFKLYLKGVVECSGSGEPLDVEEDGTTYWENALKKALRFYETFQRPVLADDSGLEVDVLGGAPGVYSARYGGADLTWEDRWAYLYSKIEATGAIGPHTGAFVCVLCYYDGLNPPVFFQGKASGQVVQPPRGNGGFGYDPIFESRLLRKTFAELSAKEKQTASHRGEALRQFSVWWKTKHPTA